MIANPSSATRRHPVNFVVLSSQRSGSTLLCELLGSHPDVVMAKELFKISGSGRNLDENRYSAEKGTAKDFLSNFFCSDATTVRSKGFKLMLDQLRVQSGLEEFIADEKISVIYLERANLLKQHVSRLAAQSSLRYHSEESGKTEPFAFATGSLLEQLDQLQRDRGELRRLAFRFNALTIAYEDLVADQTATLTKAQRFLRLEPYAQLASPLIKILAPDLNRSVANYPQVHSLLEKTEFSQYLDPLDKTQWIDQVESTFVHIPKVAGTSIEAALYGSFGKVGHRTAMERRRLDPAGFDRSFRFGFVRNPYDRFVSAFVYMRKGGRNRFDSEWAENNISHYKDFNSFVLALQQPQIAKSIMSWMHFRPQHEFLCDTDGVLMVDFVGKYETLETDFRKVSEKLGRAVTLPHLNPVERDKYEAYYSAETRAVVHSLYAKDFELFNYNE